MCVDCKYNKNYVNLHKCALEMKRFGIIPIILLLACLGVNAQSFELGALPEDPAIKRGLLPCGITYFFAPSKMSKGVTDFTLVQKMNPSLDRNTLVSIARNRFSKIDSLEKFYARNGMRPSRNGYLSVRAGAITYRVTGLSSARPESILDSTLLSLFMIMRDSALSGQPSSSQAIIVSGDYDYDKVLSKMNTLSLVVPRVGGKIEKEIYIWDEPSPNSEKLRYEGGAASRIVLRLRAKKMPDKYMNTLLPVMSDKMAGELEWVLRNRIYPVLRSRRLVADMNFKHLGSSDTDGDEQIILTVRCARSVRDNVKDLISKELDRLYTYGVEVEEYCYAREAYRYRWLESSEDIQKYNSENAARCASAFLYGVSLSSNETKMQMAYRETPDSLQTHIFNKYLAAIFRQSCVRDTSLTRAPSLLSRKVVEDSLASYVPKNVVVTKKTLKNIKDNTEYLTGGVKWSMPNGVNVVYCQKADCGGVWWSFSSRGGRKWADPDFFTCIDGIQEISLKNYMESQGINLQFHLNPVDVTLDGKAPSEKMENVLQILAALVGQKENSRVFAPDCYKLLVMVGEKPASAVKELLYTYSYAFGDGGQWSAGKPYYPQDEASFVDFNGIDGRELSVHDGNFVTVYSPMDISSWNTAVSRMAGIIIRQRLNQAFCGYGSVSEVSAAFETFPTGMFYMDYGVKTLPTERFAIGEKTLTETEIEGVLVSVLSGLSKEPIDAKLLAVVKKDMQNMFSVFSTTPEFAVRIVRDRYMDNKDLYTKFSDVINSITSETITNFFAGLTPLQDSPEQE